MRAVSKYIPKAVKLAVYAKTDGRCWYCGRAISEEAATVFGVRNIDHQRPIRQGGTNDLSNLFPACFPCNIHKGGRTLEQFRALMTKEQFDSLDYYRWAIGGKAWFALGPAEETLTRAVSQFFSVFTVRGVRFYGETMQMDPADFYVI